MIISSPRHWIQYIATGLVILGFVIFHGFYYIQTHKVEGAGKVDSAIFYVAGAAITDRMHIEPINLYSQKDIRPAITSIRKQDGGSHYLYLPQAAVLFAPATIFSFNTFVKIWAIVDSIILILAFYATVIWLVKDPDIFRWRYTLLLLCIGLAKTTISLTATGQLNGLILALLVATLIGVHKKKAMVSGISLALAATLKVFPLVWLPYLALKKQWKALLISGATLLVLWLASVPFFGLNGLPYFIQERMPEIANGAVTGVYKSSSLYGSLRQAIRNDIFSSDTEIKSQIISIVDTTHFIVTVLAGIGLVIVLFVYRKRTSAADILLDYALVMSFILLFAKIVHQQYHLWILPVIIYFWHFPLKKKFIWLHISGVIIFLLTQFGKDLPLPAIDTWVLKPQTIGILFLVITVVVLRTRWWKKDYAKD